MFKVLDTICQPTRATKYSAMVDLYAREDVVIGAGETKIVPLGVKIDLDAIKNTCLEDWEHFGYFMSSHYLELHPRSSLRAKGFIIGVGICDLDYPDEIGLIVHNPIKEGFITNLICRFLGRNTHNYNQSPYTFNKGDKIAQICLKEHKSYLLGYDSENIRSGGYGSTGL